MTAVCAYKNDRTALSDLVTLSTVCHPKIQAQTLPFYRISSALFLLSNRTTTESILQISSLTNSFPSKIVLTFPPTNRTPKRAEAGPDSAVSHEGGSCPAVDDQ
ncbi:hypothetical protein EVAR_19330_1 [Eumeta japonica]|uniref:Uncharacterized protein n=1 Tax=Eumeta variegata TaxID=151549 RepID=A0A4C1TRC8_EUMVA|nr:hypothetical protein EVAR_19330_1 [Eumeta japonica]